MKNSVLFSLTFMVIETLATLRPGPKDPFLVIPQLQCKGRQRIVPDPKYCDRVLLCGEGPEKPSIVQYCKFEKLSQQKKLEFLFLLYFLLTQVPTKWFSYPVEAASPSTEELLTANPNFWKHPTKSITCAKGWLPAKIVRTFSKLHRCISKSYRKVCTPYVQKRSFPGKVF